MSTREPRHVENVDNFSILVSKLLTFGSNYNPSNHALTIENLLTVKTQGKLVIDAVSTAEMNNKNAISSRTYSFELFDGLVTRIANTVKICGAKSMTVEQILGIIREIRGKRVSDKLSDTEVEATKVNGAGVRQVTKHNSSMKMKTENFGKLVQLLSITPEYNPNEDDLKVNTLLSKLSELKLMNEAVDESDVKLDNARASRNKVMYSEGTGLVDIAKATKMYVKALYGADSNEYAQVSGISFINKD